MNNLTVETEDAFTSLLELAANNDVEKFKHYIQNNFSNIDDIGLWYGRPKGSKQMVILQRTPLMVASTYGSIDVLKLIISFSIADLNKSCGIDKATALHCAASGGSLNAIEAVKILLSNGADPNSLDANNNRPIDVISLPPKLKNSKIYLEELLSTNLIIPTSISISDPNSNSNSNSNSPENGSPSSLDSNSSPDSAKINFVKKEYPIDPSLPDIKNGIYSTDEFRMFSFKIRPCSRAYSHDWTECPFVHPGENARRRDPRKYHYSCVPCPDFRKGACRKGDLCDYAHGVFESWLHPAQYRTRICKDGINCNRRVCFFAHTQEEIRPLYLSTGSAAASLSPYSPPLSPQFSRLSQPSLIKFTNYENLNESSSPRYSPTHKSAIMNQLMLSPINTGFSPISSPIDRGFTKSPLVGPSSARVSMLREKEENFNFRSLSSRDLGGSSWLGSAGGCADWTVGDDEFGKLLRRSNSFEIKNNNDLEEPDFGWVHSLVKETPMESEGSSSNQPEPLDLGDWLAQMRFD